VAEARVRAVHVRVHSTLASVEGRFFVNSCGKVVTLDFSPEPVLPVDEDKSISPRQMHVPQFNW
jgi:hypothetical protein